MNFAILQMRMLQPGNEIPTQESRPEPKTLEYEPKVLTTQDTGKYLAGGLHLVTCRGS